MAKREYIFVRKTTIDYDRNIIILVQHISDHPDHPVVEGSKLVRVEKYKSNWVIRPHTVFEAVRQSSFICKTKNTIIYPGSLFCVSFCSRVLFCGGLKML